MPIPVQFTHAQAIHQSDRWQGKLKCSAHPHLIGSCSPVAFVIKHRCGSCPGITSPVAPSSSETIMY